MVVFNPVGQALQLVDASLTGSIKRSDVHQVTVALAISTGGAVNLGPLESFLFSSQRSTGAAPAPATAARRPAAASLVVGRRVTGGGTPSEALAVLAIDQLKSRELEIIPSP